MRRRWFVLINVGIVLSKLGKLFYIYDNDIWPNISTASIYKRDPNEILEHSLNNGAGPIIDISRGSYHTDQYQLFSMIFNRALKDPRRTTDPSKATSFLIPYDFASDCAYYKNCAKTAGVCYDFRRCPLAPKVEELLLKSPWFLKKKGVDHVLVVGMNYAMDHYIGKPKCKSLLSKICTNCTKFAIDDYSYMYSTNSGILQRGDYWHAIPFPSDFHWSRHVKTPYPWENDDRPILASYIGSTKSYYGPAKRLRTSIAHFCDLHPADCVHQSYGANGTRSSFKVEGYNPLELSSQSVFCFQPIGDLMTRKGLFDSLMQGCIPVVFDPLTASVMYTWHWEESFWNEVVVSFDFHPIAHRQFDPIVALKAMMQHNISEIIKKQTLIKSRVFELQYSFEGYDDKYFFNSPLEYVTLVVNENFTQNNISSKTDDIYRYAVYDRRSYEIEKLEKENRKEPLDSKHLWPRYKKTNKMMRDAYDICIDHILGWHSGASIRIRNATVPECWDGWLNKKENRCIPGK